VPKTMSSQAPTFTQPLQNVVSLEGSAATFQAQVSAGKPRQRSSSSHLTPALDASAGSPVPEVSWFHDGQVLSAAALPGIQISFSEGRAVLEIPARLQSTTVSQGSQVRLDVRVTGIPAPLVKFYREGAEIQSSADFRILQEGDLHSLLIAEAFPEDSGAYSVTASSSSGRATCTAELLVQGEETIPAKKTKTLVSQMHQTEVEQRMETSFHTSTMMMGQVEAAELAHKAPPRVLPKPTSKSPTLLVAKVAAGASSPRHQSDT
ncbi:unnamed protein product, partial [Tetraodon nigroviridis]